MEQVLKPTTANILTFTYTVAAGLLLLSPAQASTSEDFLLVAYGSFFPANSGVYMFSFGNRTWSKVPLSTVTSVSAVAYDRTNDVVFWADDMSSQISMSSLDGSGQKVLVKNIGLVYGMQYSGARNTLYYSEYTKGSLTAFDIASSTRTTLATNISQPWDMALDDNAGLLFYTSGNTTGRVDVTYGSRATTATATSVKSFFGIALSSDGKDLYTCAEIKTLGGPKTYGYYSTAIGATGLFHLSSLQGDCLSLAANENYLYSSASQEVRAIPLANPGSYKSLGTGSALGGPVGIYYVKRKTETPAKAVSPLWILGAVLALAAASGVLAAVLLRRRNKKRDEEKDADWGGLRDLTPSAAMVVAHRVVRLAKIKAPGVKVTSKGSFNQCLTESKQQQRTRDTIRRKNDKTFRETKSDVPSHSHSYSKAKIQPFPL